MTLRQFIESKKLRFAISGGSEEDHKKAISTIKKHLDNNEDNNMLIKMLEGKSFKVSVDKYWKLEEILENVLAENVEDLFHELVDEKDSYWEWESEGSSVCCMGKHNLDERITND